MTALKPVPSIARLACTACGAETNASCNCGVAYNPVAIAKEAIKANSQKSNRAIAKETGVSEPTVRRARASGDEPDKVVGLDGKTYKAKAANNTRPDFEKLQAHAKERGWQGRDGKSFNLYRDIQNSELWCGDHISVIPVALRDVVETLDDIERNPGKYRDITHPQPEDDEPAPKKANGKPRPTLGQEKLPEDQPPDVLARTIIARFGRDKSTEVARAILRINGGAA